MLPKFNKQYSILKLMLGHFNTCCLILIKIFILVAHSNFALCSLLRSDKKMVNVTSTLIHQQRNDPTFSKGQDSLDHYLMFFLPQHHTDYEGLLSQIQNSQWITIQASCSFENVTSFLCLWITVDITHAIF